MIRHTPTLSELRFFEADDPPPMAPFDACCNVIWESERVVWVRMMHGRMSPKLLRELIAWLHERGVQILRAHRAPHRLLPMAVRRPDGSYELDVAAALARAAKGDVA